MTKTKHSALAAGAGLVVGLAAPPVDAYPALWLGMACLAWLLESDTPLPPFASRARVALSGARRGLVFGAAANLVALRFIPGVIARFTPLPWVAGALALGLLAVFEGLRWMVAAVACETLARARVPRPVAFAAGVYAGTFVPTMLPWTVAGGASPWPVVVQLADLVGERGVSALMALTAGLLATGVRRSLGRETRARGVALVAGALAVVGAQIAYGAVRLHGVDAERASAASAAVGLVQPGVGASTRWEPERAPEIVATLSDLTRFSEAHGAALTIWPEAAYPYPLPHGSRAEPAGAPPILGRGVRGPVLTGLLTTGGPGGSAFNSVLVATRAGLSDSYDKRHLLWFGETVPLADRIPLLREIFARGLGLAPGHRSVALEAGPVRAATLVCYEDTLPEAGREAMEDRPTLLVNVTNDAWFDGPESELHLRMAALRAVELRRDMVRAVNRGVPSWVDAAGRVLARGSPDFAAVLLTHPALLSTAPTLYARYGDAPWALASLLLANLAVWREARRRREPRRLALEHEGRPAASRGGRPPAGARAP